MEFHAGKFDIIVIGAGHAGCEAALAAARLGCSTALFTLNLDAIANLPCNPAIGGTGKGQLVREVDALGGEMGRAADACCIQYRMLNSGKGPAVYSLRAQADRKAYQVYMKNALESQENLFLRQGEITEITFDDDPLRVTGVKTRTGGIYEASRVIIATGTYLGGRVIIGGLNYESGPDGLFAATALSSSLKDIGLPLRRFKTGTPARINARSVDFSKMSVQPGDDEAEPFSFDTVEKPLSRVFCHMTHTTPKTKEVILKNLDRSPLFSGDIVGIGPRYCPSIEDKMVKFPDKEVHQLFIEPTGLGTGELYIQGLSTSMPEDIQLEIVHSVTGLERAEIMRLAYAIEYDCVDPTALKPTLETKAVQGLYGAGQFNGSSGYEEAAAQGLLAGINAALACKGREEVVIGRTRGYIGVLIDDLVTKGTNEPYRMMTSRCEHRLMLRQDNADERLTPLGHAVGLVNDEKLRRCNEKYARVEEEFNRLDRVIVPPSDDTNALLKSFGETEIVSGARLSDLLRRPALGYKALAPLDPSRPDLPFEVINQAEIRLKYDGYIKKEQSRVEKLRRMEQVLLPENIDYNEIKGLRIEAMQKLSSLRPRSLGQAGRISGVNPADVAVLMIYLNM